MKLIYIWPCNLLMYGNHGNWLRLTPSVHPSPHTLFLSSLLKILSSHILFRNPPPFRHIPRVTNTLITYLFLPGAIFLDLNPSRVYLPCSNCVLLLTTYLPNSYREVSLVIHYFLFLSTRKVYTTYVSNL